MRKYIRIGILALSIAAMPLAITAMAQTGTDPGRTASPGQTYGQTYRTEDSTDWGWLGLLGLAGLAGLFRRREEPARHRVGDPMTNR